MSILTSFRKDFVVALRSLNANSFGLRQHILIAKDGEAHAICLSYLNEQPAGTVVTATITLLEGGGRLVQFLSLHGELQEELQDCPDDRVEAFWRRTVAGLPCNLNSTLQDA